MPQQSKGPRLYLRPDRFRGGKLHEKSAWIIRDGSRSIATGCLPAEAEQAQRALAAYINHKYRPERQRKAIEEIDVLDVLTVYFDDFASDWIESDKRPFLLRQDRLAKFWAGKTLAQVNGETCRAYVQWRGKAGIARRELEDLRAAINYHRKQGYHREIVMVSLPERGEARDRWLTRSEAARLLWTAYRYREIQTVHRGSDKGNEIATVRRPTKHLARFILLGLYTGTRAGAIASASPYRAEGHSWVDLEAGVFHRLAEGRRATNKRQPPVRIPKRLLSHLKRWVSADRAAAEREGCEPPTHIVEWNGRPIKSVKVGFASAVRRAGLEGRIMPHTLRHTAATWMMQQGTDLWEASGFLGMSPEILRRVYGHHHPDFMADAADNLGYGRRSKKPVGKDKPVGETVGKPRNERFTTSQHPELTT